MSGPYKSEDRWEIATQRSNETHRVGYGDLDYQNTLTHLRKRGDTYADVWRYGTNEWRRVNLSTHRKDSSA